MMPISPSDLMSISSEASNAGLSQCELVIGIRQGFLRVGAVCLLDFWGGGSPEGEQVGQAVSGPCDGFRVRHSPDCIGVYLSSGRVSRNP